MSKETLFEKIWKGAEEALEIIKKPIIKRSIKNGISGGITSALDQGLEVELDIAKMREGMIKKIVSVEEGLNQIVALRAQQRAINDAAEDLKKEYKEMFNKEYILEEDDE